MSNLPQGMAINAEVTPDFATILTPEALALVAKLHRAFEPRRQELLKARVERTKRLDAGEKPDFLPETKHIREGDWKVAPIPAALPAINLDILYREYGFEFYWEGLRRTNQIRFGHYEDKWTEKTDTDVRHRLFPIPQTAIDGASNVPGYLIQNDGY